MALLAARGQLDPAYRAEASLRAARAIIDSDPFRFANTIALFAAIRDEADPRALETAALALGKRVAYPRIDGRTLTFVAATFDQLVPTGAYAIPEPPPSMPALGAEAIDLVVVPGLGFTRTGDRIGYGKGFYDVALARLRASHPVCCIGFGFEAQLALELVVEAHDQPLDGIATENGLTLVEKSR